MYLLPIMLEPQNIPCISQRGPNDRPFDMEGWSDARNYMEKQNRRCSGKYNSKPERGNISRDGNKGILTRDYYQHLKARNISN